MRHGKFNAQKVKQDNITFDSKLENKRYNELLLLIKAKKIEGLEVHPIFEAIVNDVRVCRIELDFRYFDREKNRLIYEDVKTKGTFTAMSRLKHKLLKALYPDVDVLLVGLA